MKTLKVRLRHNWSVLLLILVALVITCGDSPTSPTPHGYDLSLTPMDDGEAETAAYFLSGELMAPLRLYNKIRAELEMIRREWSDSLPQRKIVFSPCLQPSFLLADFDLSTLDSIKAGTYHAWDSLNEHYRLDSIEYGSFPNPIALWFHGRLNPVQLVDIYKNLPGLQRVRTFVWFGSEFIIHQGLYLRMNGRSIKYFFRYLLQGCEGCWSVSDFYYFTVEKGVTGFHGSWQSPPDNPEDTTLRPEWVDTAWQTVYENCRSASWHRDTIPPACCGEMTSDHNDQAMAEDQKREDRI